MTKTMVWFMLSDEQQDKFFKKFIRVDKLDMERILPVPSRVSDSLLWKRKNWGTTENLVPIDIDFTYFTIETDQCPSSDWFCALSEAMFNTTLTVASANARLGTDVSFFSLENEEFKPKVIQYPMKLACIVWGIDYIDFLSKYNGDNQHCVYAQDVKPCDEDDEGDDVLLFMEGVCEPICEDV